MWLAKSFFVLFAICTIVNCVPTESNILPRAVSDFASDLYEQTAKSKTGNVIISPLSVATLLALLSQAAEGQTYSELRDGLHLNGADKTTVANQYYKFAGQLQKDIGSAKFTMANQVYVRQGRTLNKNFQNVATTKFGSGVESLNFVDTVKSAETINRFVAEKTNGKIKELVKSDALDADTEVFLVNAIYFKGNWEHPFNKTLTTKGPFHTKEKQTIQTEFMQLESKLNFVHSDELHASFVELKYADSKFSFLIALPLPTSSLQELETKIKHTKLADIVSQMRLAPVLLSLPKFKVEFGIELKEVLTKLNMGTMFSNNADLSGLLDEKDQKDLVVSKVIHKAFIEINEDGSEAGGSSGAGIRPRSILRFNANSPFMYFIRDTETNTVVFSGRYETVNNQ